MLNSMLTFIAEKFKGIANYSVKTGRYETEKGIWYYEIKKNGNIELWYHGFITVDIGAGFIKPPPEIVDIIENPFLKTTFMSCTGAYKGELRSGGLTCTVGDYTTKFGYTIYLTDARLISPQSSSIPPNGDHAITFYALVLN